MSAAADSVEVDRGKRLFHYTTAAGVLGILARAELFATDLRFLNDAREFSFARDIIVERLLKSAEHLERYPDEDPDRVEARVAYIRNCAMEAGRAFNYQQIFVACFCEDGDLLSQWRGYGQIGGYSIEFDSLTLVGGNLDKARSTRVMYGSEANPELNSMVEEIVNQPANGKVGSRAYVAVESKVVPLVDHIKDDAFSEEREWRLVASRYQNAGEQEIRHRETRLGITPYVVLPFDRPAVRRVIVGPGPFPDVRRDGIKSLLISNGYPEVDVALSGMATTYR